MKLTGPQVGEFVEVVSDAFSRDDLALLAWTKLEKSLDTIVADAKINTVAFELVKWAEHQGLTAKLLQALRETRPRNTRVTRFIDPLLAEAAEEGGAAVEQRQATAFNVANSQAVSNATRVIADVAARGNPPTAEVAITTRAVEAVASAAVPVTPVAENVENEIREIRPPKISGVDLLPEHQKPVLLGNGQLDAVKTRSGVDVGDRLTALQAGYTRDFEATEAAGVALWSGRTLFRGLTSRRSLVFIAIGLVLGIVLTLLIAFAPSLYRAVFPPRYEVQYSSLTPQLSAAIKNPDESNAGVMVEDTELTVDMRPEVQVPIEQRDIRINPSTHTYLIRAVRHEDSTKVFVMTFASQRPNMDVVCLNHQYEVRRSRSDHIAGKGFENVWHLLADISDRSLNIPFEIKVRAVRWNAYQADNENFVGKTVSGSEKQFSVRVLIPDARVLRDRPVLQQHPKSPSPPIEGFNGSGELSLSGDRQAFEWKVVQPRQGFVYRAKIFWEAAPQPPVPVSSQRWKIAGGKFEPAG